MEKEEVKKVVRKKIGVTPDNSFVNVRYRPNPQSEILTVVRPATKITIISSDKTSDYYKVLLEDGSEGYILKSLLEVN